jgi:hypothetical protein
MADLNPDRKFMGQPLPLSPMMPIGERWTAILSDRSGLVLPPT